MHCTYTRLRSVYRTRVKRSLGGCALRERPVNRRINKGWLVDEAGIEGDRAERVQFNGIYIFIPSRLCKVHASVRVRGVLQVGSETASEGANASPCEDTCCAPAGINAGIA